MTGKYFGQLVHRTPDKRMHAACSTDRYSRAQVDLKIFFVFRGEIKYNNYEKSIVLNSTEYS
jgi:hypothetical protein